jgi:hypothetical protein
MPWYGLLLTGCGLADFCVTFAFFAMISLHPLLQRGCHRGRGRPILRQFHDSEVEHLSANVAEICRNIA